MNHTISPEQRADDMYRLSDWCDQWWQRHDGIAAQCLKRALADQAQETLDSLVSTVATMGAEDKSDAEIGAMARRVCESWLETHRDALLSFK